MLINWQNILETMQAMPVDTQAQQALVLAAQQGAGQGGLLVAGVEEADPMALLPGGNPFIGGKAPLCAVRCVPGKSLCILTENTQGVVERFRSAQDYCAIYGADPEAVTACTVETPAMQQSGAALYFAVLTPDNREQYSRWAALTGSCAFVVYAEAGNVGEETVALSHLVDPARSVLILNHLENVFFPNDMLALQLHEGKLPVLECDCTLDGEGGPQAVLAQALATAGSGAADASPALERAWQAILQKLDERIAQADKKLASLNASVKKIRDAEGFFRAEAASRRYALRALIGDDLLEGMQKDLEDLTTELKEQLPGMVDEVVDTCDKPKEALKNLLAEYVSSVYNTAVTESLDRLVNEHCLPGMNRILQESLESYTRITSVELSIDQAEDPEVEDSFMRLTHLHMGDFHTALATILPTLLTNVTRWILYYFQLGFLARILYWLEGPVTSALSDAIDALRPTRGYASALLKAVLGQLDGMQGNLSVQVEESIIPRLCEVMESEYMQIIDDEAAELTAQADKLQQRADAAEKDKAVFLQAAQRCRQELKED